MIKTTATLRLEFRQILKIDNLQDLTSLTRLFLDNNFIEKVTGLEFLSNLVWLDLSFNKIQKIDGLSSQKNLQVLALYQNEIKVRSIYFWAYDHYLVCCHLFNFKFEGNLLSLNHLTVITHQTVILCSFRQKAFLVFFCDFLGYFLLFGYE